MPADMSRRVGQVRGGGAALPAEPPDQGKGGFLWMKLSSLRRLERASSRRRSLRHEVDR